MKSSASIKSIVSRLLLVTVGMFGFGFALVPLYDMFCDITGLNGKTNAEAFIPLADLIDTSSPQQTRPPPVVARRRGDDRVVRVVERAPHPPNIVRVLAHVQFVVVGILDG